MKRVLISACLLGERVSKTKLPGKVGETTRVLQEAGVRVFSELQWAEADAFISAGD